MRVGCHVSISGGIDRSVGNAISRECNAFQIFSRNPRGWRAKEISDGEAEAFHEQLAGSRIEASATCVHMPYLPNLSSTNAESHARSVATLVDEVRRCGKLGIPFLVTHLGSHLGAGSEAGIGQLTKAYTRAAEVDNDVVILLENTAGQKNSVGSDFEELDLILSGLKPQERFGVCLDTCHAFAYGYDLRTEEAAGKTLEIFDDVVGFDRLKILHLNDAKGELGSRLDRHYHIGLGNIGEAGMRTVIQSIEEKDIPIILETPIDSTRDDLGNVRTVRALARTE